jgi:hypothetical protein
MSIEKISETSQQIGDVTVPRELLSKAVQIMEVYASVVDAHAIEVEEWDGYIYPWHVVRALSMLADSGRSAKDVECG